jgi:hypothetical protein
MITNPFTIYLCESLRIDILRRVNGYLLTDLFLYILAIIMLGLLSLALMLGMFSGDILK